MAEVRVIHGDMREQLQALKADGVRVHSIVTDPPYHLTSGNVAVDWGAMSERSTAHGGGGPKGPTNGAGRGHKTGFMGKAWDGGDIAFQPETWRLCYDLLPPGGHMLCFGGTRTFHRLACAVEDAGFTIRDTVAWITGSGFPKSHNLDGEWDGWGSALKPALELVCVARKPLIGTIAANVLAHGTGALNIDGCRVEGQPEPRGMATGLASTKFFSEGNHKLVDKQPHDLGRWPANVCHDGSAEVVKAFPESGGQNGSVSGDEPSSLIKNAYGARQRVPFGARMDEGSAARFFYSAKADESDRLNSKHPTVKPTSLMRWLVRLVTPPCVTKWKCVSCNNETLPSMQNGIQAEIQRTNPLLDQVPQFESRPSQETTASAVSHLQRDADEVLEKVLFGEMRARGIEATSEPVPDVQRTVQAEGRSNVLLPAMRAPVAKESSDTLSDMQDDVPARETQPSVLQSEMFPSPSDTRSDRHPRGLSDTLETGAPDGDEIGLFDGTSVRDGGTPGQKPGEQRDSASHQRNKDRQPIREPSSIGGDDTQSSAQGPAQVDSVSALQSHVHTRSCPACGGPLTEIVERGVVLDPFAGSGTTGMACMAEGFDCILVEREAEYVADIKARIAHVHGTDTPLFAVAAE